MASTYHWLDEREGHWTEIVDYPGYTLIRLRRNHRRGVIVSTVLVVLMVYVFARAVLPLPAGWGREIILFGIASIIGMLFTTFRRYRLLTEKLPLAIGEDQAMVSGDVQRLISPCEIEAIEGRENLGRKGSDSRMYQIYFHLQGNDQAELIHQDYFNRRERVLESARELAKRWGVPLREN